MKKKILQLKTWDWKKCTPKQRKDAITWMRRTLKEMLENPKFYSDTFYAEYP